MGLFQTLCIFFLSASIIVMAAIAVSASADVIARRSRLGRLWVGSLLLAGATSLPEMVTNISAVRMEAYALAGGNVLGANMLNMAALGFLVAVLKVTELYQVISRQQLLVAGFALFMTSLALLFMWIIPEIHWSGISLASIILLITFPTGTWLLYRFTARPSETEESEPPPDRSLRWGLTVFFIAAAGIFVSGPFLSYSAERIADLTGVGESFFGVLAVAFITTLPEMTAAITALRSRAYDLAVAGMYGSNAFNIAILGIADLFSPRSSLFVYMGRSHLVAGITACILMGIGSFQMAIRHRLRRRPFSDPAVIATIGIYMLGIYSVFLMS